MPSGHRKTATNKVTRAVFAQLEVWIRGRGEVQATSAISRTQTHCIAGGTSISTEWIPSAFLRIVNEKRIVGAIHHSVPGLPTRKARIPPAGTG